MTGVRNLVYLCFLDAPANTTVPVWQSVSAQAVHGANNNTVSGNVFVPQTSEAYSYDLDCNLTSDGRPEKICIWFDDLN